MMKPQIPAENGGRDRQALQSGAYAKAGIHGAVLTKYSMELENVSLSYGEDFQSDKVQLPSQITDTQVSYGKLSFSAVPLDHEETDTACLVIIREELEVFRILCDWQNTAYRTEFVLPVLDGYVYCFVLERNGIQQLQYLRETGCEALAAMTAMKFEVFEPKEVTYNETDLVFVNQAYAYYMPELGVENNWRWEQIDFVLENNNEEIARYSDHLPHASPEEPTSSACLRTMSARSEGRG